MVPDSPRALDDSAKRGHAHINEAVKPMLAVCQKPLGEDGPVLAQGWPSRR
jgi:hypothetical protein